MGRGRQLIALLATLVVLAPVAWLWWTSLPPHSYSVMDMGYLDGGGGPVPGAAAMTGPAGRSVATLVDPSTGPADVDVTLTARQGPFRLRSGQAVDGYTLNGTSPGPVIRAVEGQLVQVRLVNASVAAGVTLHWHGVDVPDADDGVAGVTQDAVPVGGSYVYRFRVQRAGTFWYHSHQDSHEQVEGGLFGALVVSPKAPVGAETLALVHLYNGVRTINGVSGDVRDTAPAGVPVRVRVINTDNGPMPVWVDGAPFRLVAVDGTDEHDPGSLQDVAVTVTAGGRADLEVDVPATGARVEMGGSASVVLGPGVAAVPRPTATLDLLHYGTPAPLGFDPRAADRHFEYAIGRRPGFLGGVPGLWWTINGHLFPDVPMFVVTEGDIVTMHIVNNSGQVHPMHLHGHHLVVLSRNGVAATGGPWWIDSLDVADGDSYDVAFVADNPGIWMDHCHNLPHATQGLVAHLMYAGVTDPYTVGGSAGNEPE